MKRSTTTKENLIIQNENKKLKSNFESKISRIDALERSNENLRSVLNAQLTRLESLEKIALNKNDRRDNQSIFSEFLSKMSSGLKNVRNISFVNISKPLSKGN